MISQNEVLSKCIEVRDLLSDPKKHTIKVFARNSFGYEVGISSTTATCYCFAGAISKVCNDFGARTDLYKSVHGEFMKEINQILPGARYVVAFNDTNKYEVVMVSIEKTISRLQKEMTDVKI